MFSRNEDNMVQEIHDLELEQELLNAKKGVRLTKAEISELKRRYGKDWLRVYKDLVDSDSFKALGQRSFRMV